MVYFESVGQISDSGPGGGVVGVGDDDDVVPAVDEFLWGIVSG